jgi:ABC-type branched-subunit amino acid transport system substrate-binding protein
MLSGIRRVAAGLVAWGALAACGTTVPLSDVVASSGTSLDAATGSTSGLVAAPNSTSASDGVARPGVDGAQAASPDAQAGADVVAENPGPDGAVTSLDRPIRIGFASTDITAIAAAFGRDPSADPVASARKIAAYINAHGGIAGRKIELVPAQGDSGTDANTNGQQVCSALTEDTRVDIVVNLNMGGELFPTCLQQHGVAVVDAALASTDAADMRRHPNWLVPLAMRMDRSAPALLRNAVERGVLKRDDTVGVLREDCPWGARIYNQVVVPEANRLGVKLVVGTVKCIENLVADLAPVTSDIQRETLRFGTSGVTHMMALSPAEAFLVAQFSGNASRQGYHPKYLVTSNAYPYGNSQPDAVVSISPDALPNMSGIGMYSLLDVGDQARPVDAIQAAFQKECKAADPSMLGSETQTDSGRYFKRNTYYGMCDAFFVTKALLEANGVRTSVTDVVQGYRAALHRALASAVLAGGRFELDSWRLDGVGTVRPFAYDARAERFAYVGPPVSID